MRAEAAAHHAPLFARHAREYPPKIREALEEGRRVSAVDFLAAQEERRRFRREAAEIARRWDVLLLPTAGAPAPRGLGSTGDPYFCAPWSAAGLPAIALPSGVGASGLPLSIQLVGGPFAEARLLAAAAWCERALDFSAAPPL
jgi:amidase